RHYEDAEDADAQLRHGLGRHPQVHLLGLLPPGRQVQGLGRVHQPAHQPRRPAAPDLGPVRGPPARLHCVPRAHPHVQGVRVHRHGRGSALARGPRRRL
ncbi:hypothetical protein BN1723_020652, partial [Verticillium longisporum]